MQNIRCNSCGCNKVRKKKKRSLKKSHLSDFLKENHCSGIIGPDAIAENIFQKKRKKKKINTICAFDPAGNSYRIPKTSSRTQKRMTTLAKEIKIMQNEFCQNFPA